MLSKSRNPLLIGYSHSFNLFSAMKKSKKPIEEKPKEVESAISAGTNNQIILRIHATPGSKKSAITSIDENAINVSINARPVDGAANKELLDFMISSLNLRKTEIDFQKGAKSRSKVLMSKHWDDCFASLTSVSALDSDGSSTSSANSGDLERWIRKSVTIHGINVCAYALISGFGKGTSFLQYVSKNLVNLFLQSNELEEILNEMSRIQMNVSNTKYIDDQIIKLIKNVFLNINVDYFEQYELQRRQNNRMGSNDELISWDTFDSISLSDPNSNGSSVILSVIVKDRFFVANVGNSVSILFKQMNEAKESYVFQLTELHESPKQMTELHALPNKCFGGYSDDTTKTESNSEPFVVSQGIQLDHTMQFLLFASPLAVKIVTHLNLDNLDNVNTYLASMVIDDLVQTKSIKRSLNNVVQRLVDYYNKISNSSNSRPSVAIGYIDLKNENSTNDQQQEQAEDLNNMVPSEIDWTEFDTHEMRDLFIATVNSIKKAELPKILEH
ncbi:hypothetical protein M3Y97_00564700 [Aphelenchoides bicaudatus]|nr:hypothetical protein M3Y97_00564700 [Aphelenchoides bicaudatus]